MQNNPLAFQDPTDKELDELQGDSVLKTPLHRLGRIFKKFESALKERWPVNLEVGEGQIVPLETLLRNGRGLWVHCGDRRAVAEH